MEIKGRTNKNIMYYYKYTWPLGFGGFTGLVYFINHDPKSLFGFIFFMFFGNYFIGKLAGKKKDERFLENGKRAWLIASKIPFLLLLVMSLCIPYFSVTKEFFIALSSLGYGVTIIVYYSVLHYFERYT